MGNTPLVSVIVPIYNGEKYLEATLNSVISQTYNNWEMILIDDGSTDRSLMLINKFAAIDNRIKAISLKKCSGGPATPRNVGIEMSKGKYLAFLDADDLWKKDKLMLQMRVMEKFNFDVVHCGAFIVDSDESVIGVLNSAKKYKLLERFFSPSLIFLIFNPVVLSSSLISREIGMKFKEDPKLQAIEDWCMWIEISLLGKKLKMLDQNLVFYRQHAGSISKDNGRTQYLKGFYLYSCLLVEKKIGLGKYLLLNLIQFLRILKNSVKVS